MLVERSIMSIKLIPGNCQQIAIMESIIASQANVIKIKSGDNTPLFASQSDFESRVHYTEYLMGSNNGVKFLPQVYTLKFEYNHIKNTASMKLDRGVIAQLEKEHPGIFAGLKDTENGQQVGG